jgi:hypothetical protein
MANAEVSERTIADLRRDVALLKELAESEGRRVAARDARIKVLTEALKRISQPLDCACMPCWGQCRSAESLQIELDERCDLADAALAAKEERRG